MAWTAPMTFVASTPLTAAQLNTHLRDNLLETAPAKATESGGYFVATGESQLVQRVPRRHTIDDEQTTTSTAFDDLATVGPTVTAQTGEAAFVFWGCEMRNNSTSITATCRMGVEVTGASNNAAADIRALTNAAGQDSRHQSSHGVLYDDLTSGTNTFTAKYRVSSGQGSFQRRRLVVFPL